MAAAKAKRTAPRWLRPLLVLSTLSIAAGSFPSGGLLDPPTTPPFVPRQATASSVPSSAPLAFSIRGGAAVDADADATTSENSSSNGAEDSSDADPSPLVGSGATCVLDLRPESVRSAAPLSAGGTVADVFRAASGPGGDGRRSAVLVPVPATPSDSSDGGADESSSASDDGFLLGIFPGDGDGGSSSSSSSSSAEADPEKAERGLHRLSSAAESLGSGCDSVVLLVACGSDGTTSLHRSAGLMLAGLMNGLRRRCSGGSSSSTTGAPVRPRPRLRGRSEEGSRSARSPNNPSSSSGIINPVTAATRRSSSFIPSRSCPSCRTFGTRPPENPTSSPPPPSRRTRCSASRPTWTPPACCD
uniref:Uncharacterized protein n=1 Tax=Odontella aurita TaxID=265563 RepID=A0A7S4MQ55_9STRA